MSSKTWFASDNNASTHPRIMEALQRANLGHAVGYGDDPLTQEAEAAVARLFQKPGDALPRVHFALNGTGANVFGLGSVAGQGDAIFCSDCAHILVDESGAPTAVLGAQVFPLDTRQGKVLPESLSVTAAEWQDHHKARPVALTLSQPTELGTLYTLEEINALCDIAHRFDMIVHIDGARLANAAAALGSDLSDTCGTADIISFGGTKNGLMFGEAVVFMPQVFNKLRHTTQRLHKTRLQLASKMRYIAAQFLEYTKDSLWLENARHSNAMASYLSAGALALGLRPEYPVDTNGIFICLPEAIKEPLREKHFFYDWKDGIVRWMPSWDSRKEDIDAFLASIKSLLNEHNIDNSAIQTAGERQKLKAELLAGRDFLKASWQKVAETTSDQRRGLPPPPFTSPVPENAELIQLPEADRLDLGKKPFSECVAERQSRRKFSPKAISLDELAWLLWASAGIKLAKSKYAFRTVPSAGCRHPIDTIIYARNIDGLPSGIYRYIAEKHALARILGDAGSDAGSDADAVMDRAIHGQLWNCAALFVWTAIPYRMEWRYTVASPKLVALDAGHICQAHYYACEALGLGTCAVGSYDQKLLDSCLGIDGVDEFAVYLAPVGKI